MDYRSKCQHLSDGTALSERDDGTESDVRELLDLTYLHLLLRVIQLLILQLLPVVSNPVDV
jgi:hypothetical protein